MIPIHLKKSLFSSSENTDTGKTFQSLEVRIIKIKAWYFMRICKISTIYRWRWLDCLVFQWQTGSTNQVMQYVPMELIWTDCMTCFVMPWNTVRDRLVSKLTGIFQVLESCVKQLVIVNKFLSSLLKGL